jgi:glycerol-3-phosphate acyltransferase PlsY
MIYVLSALLGYLLGSIPFGLVLCKMAGYGDIRKIGSGNIGATNVLRTGNKPLALATLLLDSGKGAIAVILIPIILNSFGLVDMHYVGSCIDVNTGEHIPCGSPVVISGALNSLGMIAGFAALIGHCYPVWLKFKGGKGVATTLGTLIALVPTLGAIACGIWFLSAVAFRISSLSALIAVGLTPIIAHYLYGDPNLSGLCAAITALVYLKHRENIKRIFKGEEPKIGKKKQAEK